MRGTVSVCSSQNWKDAYKYWVRIPNTVSLYIFTKEKEKSKMTYKERLKKEHPKKVGEIYLGGCAGCPGDYWDGAPNSDSCSHDIRCLGCWNTEIPNSDCAEAKNEYAKRDDFGL